MRGNASIEAGSKDCGFTGCLVVERESRNEGQQRACGSRQAWGCPQFIRCLQGCENAIRTFSIPPRVPAWKRILDIGCILLAAPAWVPLMAFLALFVKSVSPGPVFFRQERVGFRGRRFACLKFRTMKVNADSSIHREHLRQLISADHPMTKMDALGDSRLVWGGRFLRSSGLDELPQLFNVLKGEMSLVGPRPCTPFELEHYEEWQRKRFSVLPGLTGLWQVSGKNKTTFLQMIFLDLYYAQSMSPLLDCRIMLKTLGVLTAQVEETHRGGNTHSAAFPATIEKSQRVPVA